MEITNIDILQSHLLSCYPQEGCGIVINNTFIPVENISDNPADSFEMDKNIYLDNENELQAIIHSHTLNIRDLDPRTPSYEDMKSADSVGLPFGIVHVDGENVSDILWFNCDEVQPFLNRDYIPSVYDCYTLLNDYYRVNYNIDFGLHPRPPYWEDWDSAYLYKSILTYEQGFDEISSKILDKQEILQKGDIIIFRIGATYPTHFGVAISEEKFIHHLFLRKSCEDTLLRWKRQILYIYRYRAI